MEGLWLGEDNFDVIIVKMQYLNRNIRENIKFTITKKKWRLAKQNLNVKFVTKNSALAKYIYAYLCLK